MTSKGWASAAVVIALLDVVVSELPVQPATPEADQHGRGSGSARG